MAFPHNLRMVSNSSLFGAAPSVGASTSNFIIKFPECWDGVRTDSPDHISHMATATGKGCPSSHPVRVPALTMVVRYPIQSLSGHTLSSGPLSTMHADFWNTWHQPSLEALVDRCLNNSTRAARGSTGRSSDVSAGTCDVASWWFPPTRPGLGGPVAWWFAGVLLDAIPHGRSVRGLDRDDVDRRVGRPRDRRRHHRMGHRLPLLPSSVRRSDRLSPANPAPHIATTSSATRRPTLPRRFARWRQDPPRAASVRT